MSEAAKVLDLDQLARFRAAVIKALEELRLAIAEADSEVGRVRGWIERDQVYYWRGQVRKAQEKVTTCKSALFRKQMITSSKDQKPSVVDEKKDLERAQARLAMCEQKMAATKRWAIQITREEILFKAGMAPLTTVVERELPHSAIMLKKMIEHLEAYMRLAAPDLSKLLGERAPDLIADMRRRGNKDGPEGELDAAFDAASAAFADPGASGSSASGPSDSVSNDGAEGARAPKESP